MDAGLDFPGCWIRRPDLLLRTYDGWAAVPRPNSELSLEFTAGYLIEQSLSVDNLFVFLLIFRYFRVPRSLQHNVLFWGILGALVMRAIFIVAGITLLNRFHWFIYIFGAILIYSGVKLFGRKGLRDQTRGEPAAAWLS